MVLGVVVLGVVVLGVVVLGVVVLGVVVLGVVVLGVVVLGVVVSTGFVTFLSTSLLFVIITAISARLILFLGLKLPKSSPERILLSESKAIYATLSAAILLLS